MQSLKNIVSRCFCYPSTDSTPSSGYCSGLVASISSFFYGKSENTLGESNENEPLCSDSKYSTTRNYSALEAPSNEERSFIKLTPLDVPITMFFSPTKPVTPEIIIHDPRSHAHPTLLSSNPANISASAESVQDIKKDSSPVKSSPTKIILPIDEEAEKQADLNRQVIYAAQTDDHNMLKTAIEKGGDPNAIDKDGITALMHALIYEHSNIVNLLFKKYKAKAKVPYTINKNYKDKEGNTLLILVYEIFFHYSNQTGSQAETFSKIANKLMAELLRRDVDIYSQNDSGKTILSFVIEFNNYRLVSKLLDIVYQDLLDENIDINEKEEYLLHALKVGIFKCEQLINYYNLLLADYNTNLNNTSNILQQILQVADNLITNHEILKLFVLFFNERLIDFESTEGKESIKLQEKIDMLLEKTPLLDFRDRDGNTFFILSYENKFQSIFNWILKNKTVKNREALKCLELSIELEDISTLQTLCERLKNNILERNIPEEAVENWLANYINLALRRYHELKDIYNELTNSPPVNGFSHSKLNEITEICEQRAKNYEILKLFFNFLTDKKFALETENETLTLSGEEHLALLKKEIFCFDFSDQQGDKLLQRAFIYQKFYLLNWLVEQNEVDIYTPNPLYNQTILIYFIKENTLFCAEKIVARVLNDISKESSGSKKAEMEEYLKDAIKYLLHTQEALSKELSTIQDHTSEKAAAIKRKITGNQQFLSLLGEK